MLQFVRKFTNMVGNTPMEDIIRQKVMQIPATDSKVAMGINEEMRQLTAALAPTTLEIVNDSQKHSHHRAMEGVSSKETHFR